MIENREKEYRSALHSGQKFRKHKICFLFLENSVMSIRKKIKFFVGLVSCLGLFRLEVFKDFIIILTNMKPTFYDKHIVKSAYNRESLISIMRMKEEETMEEYYIF